LNNREQFGRACKTGSLRERARSISRSENSRVFPPQTLRRSRAVLFVLGQPRWRGGVQSMINPIAIR
jgi:hypothetical protein